jgi:hypothetical protein
MIVAGVVLVNAAKGQRGTGSIQRTTDAVEPVPAE